MANDAEKALGAQIANSKALGFVAFAIFGWMQSMIFAGWFPAPETFAVKTALDVATFATYALLVAALVSFLRGETWHAVFFMFWAAVAWSVQGGGEVEAQAFRGWFFLTVGIFHAFLASGAFQDRELGTDRALVALGVSLYSLGSALAAWGLGGIFFVLSGYLGLLVALVAFWITAQEIGAAGETA